MLHVSWNALNPLRSPLRAILGIFRLYSSMIWRSRLLGDPAGRQNKAQDVELCDVESRTNDVTIELLRGSARLEGQAQPAAVV